MDPKEENDSKNIQWIKDEKGVDLCLKYDGEESSSDDKFIELAPIQRIKNQQELDQKQSNVCLKVSSNIKWEMRILSKTGDESNSRNIGDDVMEPCAIKVDIDEIAAQELNYSHEIFFKSEIMEQEEVHIKHEECNEYRLKIEKNIAKEFDEEVKIVMESGAIKKETNTESPTFEELNYASENSFQPKTILQEEAQDESMEHKKERLNKKRRKRGNSLVLHQCPECPYRSTNKFNLQIHSVTHKNPDEVAWYSCQECPFKTKYKPSLKMHSFQHKKGDDIYWYKCQHCPYKTYRKYSLKIHSYIHNNLTLKCSKCSYEASTSTMLKQHRINHRTNIQWLHCSECSFKARLPSLLRTHLLAHKNDAFKCSKCSYQSRTKGQLTIHQVKHESMDKWHSCPLCPYKTYDKGTLRKHCKGRHSTDQNNPKEIKIFKCTECSFGTRFRTSLKVHRLTHDQSSWLQCPDCAYKTPYKSIFKKHQMRHKDENGEGWHRCPECSYKTPCKYTMRRHVMTHNPADKIHECSQCSYKAVQKIHLREHQFTHREAHEIEWFWCYECSFKTKRKTYLMRHVSKHRKQIHKDNYLQNSEMKIAIY